MKRKIEAWTGPDGDTELTMIGALVQAADGSIEQIDDSLSAALKGHALIGSPDLAPDLIAALENSGYLNVHLEFPWEGTSE